MRPTSLLDRRAIDPHLARIALEGFEERCRAAASLAAVLAGVCVVLALLDLRAAALPVAAGAFAGALMFLRAYELRQGLVTLLVGQRSAYVIPQIARAGERLATPEARAAISTALR